MAGGTIFRFTILLPRGDDAIVVTGDTNGHMRFHLADVAHLKDRDYTLGWIAFLNQSASRVLVRRETDARLVLKRWGINRFDPVAVAL